MKMKKLSTKLKSLPIGILPFNTQNEEFIYEIKEFPFFAVLSFLDDYNYFTL